jgi:hypothetical protein
MCDELPIHSREDREGRGGRDRKKGEERGEREREL